LVVVEGKVVVFVDGLASLVVLPFTSRQRSSRPQSPSL